MEAGGGKRRDDLGQANKRTDGQRRLELYTSNLQYTCLVRMEKTLYSAATGIPRYPARIMQARSAACSADGT